jgi:hypothetical protein
MVHTPISPRGDQDVDSLTQSVGFWPVFRVVAGWPVFRVVAGLGPGPGSGRFLPRALSVIDRGCVKTFSLIAQVGNMRVGA